MISHANEADSACEAGEGSADGEWASEHTPEVQTRSAAVEDHGQRLDKVLARQWPHLSRAWLQHLIAQGHVQLAGQTATKSAHKVKAGEVLQVTLVPTAQASAFTPEPMTLAVCYEDDDLMVIDKPAGLVVHPAAGHWQGTLLNGLLAHHAQAKHLPRAGIVHRLDKDTSGLMVVAKTQASFDALVHQIAQRDVQRVYVALAHGIWQEGATVELDRRIGRDTRNRLRMAGFDPQSTQAKSALTRVRWLANSPLLAQGQGFCWVTCKLHTGRTHQIRVHLSELGYPLVADVLYGGHAALGLTRQALHAARLAFVHPRTGQWLALACEPPSDLLEALAQSHLNYNEATLWSVRPPSSGQAPPLSS